MSLRYRTAGNFRGRKLSRIGENTIFAEKTFPLLACAAPIFAEKNSRANSHKTAKFARKFSPSKVFRYIYGNPSLVRKKCGMGTRLLRPHGARGRNRRGASTMSHVITCVASHMGVGLAEDDKEVEGMCLQW